MKWRVPLILGVVGVTAWPFRHTVGTSDVELWFGWIQQVLAAGPLHGYVAIHADYPPGASFVLWAGARLALATGFQPHAALKLTLFAFLLATTVIFLLASRRFGLTAIAYGSLILNSIALMYLDIFTAPFVLGGIWAATVGRPALMFGLIASACLMKWQPLFLMPFALVYFLRQRPTMTPEAWRRQVIVTGALLAGLACVAVGPYGLAPVYDSLHRASRHNDLSAFAANPLWLITWWFERTSFGDGLVRLQSASRLELRLLSALTLVAYSEALRRYWTAHDRTLAAFLRFSLVGYLVYFMCSAGVHENHLFLAGVLSLALAWQQPRLIWVALVVSIAANANLLAFYGWAGAGAQRVVYGVDETVLVAAAISSAMAVVVGVLIKQKAQLPLRMAQSPQPDTAGHH